MWIQQHKTQIETCESNSTKHKLKHVNPAAQNREWNRWIQQQKAQSETCGRCSTNTTWIMWIQQHKTQMKHVIHSWFSLLRYYTISNIYANRKWNSLIIQFVFCADEFTCFSLWLVSFDSHAWRVCAAGFTCSSLRFMLLHSHPTRSFPAGFTRVTFCFVLLCTQCHNANLDIRYEDNKETRSYIITQAAIWPSPIPPTSSSAST
jgi:hypothetical protein